MRRLILVLLAALTAAAVSAQQVSWDNGTLGIDCGSSVLAQRRCIELAAGIVLGSEAICTQGRVDAGFCPPAALGGFFPRRRAQLCLGQDVPLARDRCAEGLEELVADVASLPACVTVSTTVAGLPACTGGADGQVVQVTDGLLSSDCTVGLGSDQHRCECTGGAWIEWSGSHDYDGTHRPVGTDLDTAAYYECTDSAWSATGGPPGETWSIHLVQCGDGTYDGASGSGADHDYDLWPDDQPDTFGGCSGGQCKVNNEPDYGDICRTWQMSLGAWVPVAPEAGPLWHNLEIRDALERWLDGRAGEKRGQGQDRLNIQRAPPPESNGGAP